MTFRQALQALWRQRLVLIAAVIIALAAGVLRVEMESKSYAATATVQLTAAVPAGADSSGSTTQTETASPNLAVITSDVVANSAATILNRPGEGGTLAGDIVAQYDPTGNTVSITATTSSGQNSVAVAAAFAQAYKDYQQQQQKATVTSVQSTLDKIAAKLAGVSQSDPLYAALVARRAQLNSTLAELILAPEPVAAIANPGFASLVSQSSKTHILGIALVIGLLAGIGLALVRDQLDTSVRTTDAAEELTGFPVLAELPYVRKLRRGTSTLAVVSSPREAFAAAVRELRTSVGVALGAGQGRVLIVTSSVPSEGKSLISANLAAAYALSGKQTVLISGDLRRPSLQRFFGGRISVPGLINLLTTPSNSPLDVEGALRPTGVENLRFMSSGKGTGDPADAFAGPQMAAVIGALRELADVVIVDTPPVMASSDASILAGHTDGVLMVIRAGRTSAKQINDAIKRLQVSRAAVVGVALNRLKKVAGNFGDYYRSEPSLDNDQESDDATATEPEQRAVEEGPAEVAPVAVSVVDEAPKPLSETNTSDAALERRHRRTSMRLPPPPSVESESV